MSQKNHRRKPLPASTNRDSLLGLRDWFLPDSSIFAALRPHGNTVWLPVSLVWMSLIWSWSESRNLTDAFTEAARQFRSLQPEAMVTTYQGFMYALGRWTPLLMPILLGVLHQRMEQVGSRFWRIGPWVPIAFDGSRNTTPRTVANETAFCAKNYGRGNRAKYGKKKSRGMRRAKNKKNPCSAPQPQVWITLLWHMGLRLPWKWQMGPSNSSEREHVMEMVKSGWFPKLTLFCGDAGFVGFPLWSRILDSNCDFLVRVGANVTLLSESADWRFEGDKREGLVLCWPKAVMDKDQPPLRLRLMRVQIGKARVWLLTSVLNPAELTIKQATRLYQMRWGIEVEFRGLKQTLDRAKLRCRNDRRLLVELDWSILGMAVAKLFALKEQLSARRPEEKANEPPADPAKLSLAGTMRALREALRYPDDVSRKGQDLSSRLGAAVIDSYTRKAKKAARYRPKNPDKKALGDPKLRQINDEEREKLREIESKTTPE